MPPEHAITDSPQDYSIFLIGPNGKLMSGMLLRGERIKEVLSKVLERMEGAAAANRPHDEQTDSNTAPAEAKPTTQAAEN